MGHSIAPLTKAERARFDLTMDHSRAALVEFDIGSPARDLMLETARTARQVVKWSKAEEAALRKVRQAFFEDTKDRNSHDNCMMVGIGYIRQCVAWADDAKDKAGATKSEALQVSP